MNRNIEVTEKDRELMAQLNITSETRTLFHSEGYKYDNLKDAVSYARLSAEKKLASDDK